VKPSGRTAIGRFPWSYNVAIVAQSMLQAAGVNATLSESARSVQTTEAICRTSRGDGAWWSPILAKATLHSARDRGVRMHASGIRIGQAFVQAFRAGAP
jgi:hypothetical protein